MEKINSEHVVEACKELTQQLGEFLTEDNRLKSLAPTTAEQREVVCQSLALTSALAITHNACCRTHMRENIQRFAQQMLDHAEVALDREGIDRDQEYSALIVQGGPAPNANRKRGTKWTN